MNNILDLIGQIITTILVAAMIIGIPILVSINKTAEFNESLKGVGIERIVKCNNVHSNWYEIVWIEKK